MVKSNFVDCRNIISYSDFMEIYNKDVELYYKEKLLEIEKQHSDTITKLVEYFNNLQNISDISHSYFSVYIELLNLKAAVSQKNFYVGRIKIMTSDTKRIMYILKHSCFSLEDDYIVKIVTAIKITDDGDAYDERLNFYVKVTQNEYAKLKMLECGTSDWIDV